MNRALFCGSRDFTRGDKIVEIIDALPTGSVVIQGMCRGADSIARAYALSKGMLVDDWPAWWKRQKRGAGPIRNQRMLDNAKPNQVYAFYTDYETSRGTRDMIERVHKTGDLFILIAEYEEKTDKWLS